MTSRFFIHYSKRTLLFAFAILLMGNLFAQEQRSVLNSNSFTDNWEVSFGIEELSFYSHNEEGLELSKNPFHSGRTNFGAAASIGKWFTPQIGFRTKASGYWGKAIISNTARENSIKFYNIQEQAMFNLFNIINGYDSYRKWDLIPYGGVGFVRDCSHNKNSIGAGFGMINTFRISDHIKIYTDLGLTFAGDNFRKNEIDDVIGSYHWFSFNVGLSFNLGRLSWFHYNNRQGERIRITPTHKTYQQVITDKKYEIDYKQIIADTPVPEGMILVNRGHVRMGFDKQDSIWGLNAEPKNISVDDFWMDKTEVTNAQYKAFINDVCDSIIAQKMAMDSLDYEQVRASFYVTNPVTGEKSIDTHLIHYTYEVYDYAESVKHKYKFSSNDSLQQIWISKDTAYIDNSGNIIKKTINRPYSGAWDFLHTYIVNIYPDTTCWINDFPNANNDLYTKYYFSHPDYKNHPVVGVTWEQANAYCAWRTQKMKKEMGDSCGEEQPFRLPTEAEWEYAAKVDSQNDFPWKGGADGHLYANYMPDDGDYTKDGNIITARVGIYPSNTKGLYDMAGNVAEWTSTIYTPAGIEIMNNVNPQLKYNAAIEDPDRMKLKIVKGGSWKDPESHIRSAWRIGEHQNQPRSYIGFRCVRSIATTPSEKTVLVVKKK